MEKILLADEHSAIRSWFRIIIEQTIVNTKVEEASNAETILEKVKMEDFRLIVMDANMAGPNPVTVLENILGLRSEAKVLIFSMNSGDGLAKNFLQAGAMGYLNKSAKEPEIKKALESVLSNKKYINPGLLENLLQETISERSRSPFDRLSKREMEITRLMLAGATPESISVALGVDISTIGNYRSRIFSKLGCKTVEGIRSLA